MKNPLLTVLLLVVLAAGRLAIVPGGVLRPAAARAYVVRYYRLAHAEIPALLAWLRGGGLYNQPAPSLLPAAG